MNESVAKSVDLLEYLKEYRKFAIECVRVACLEIKPYEVQHKSIRSIKEATEEITHFNNFISKILGMLPNTTESDKRRYSAISDMSIESAIDDAYQIVFTYKTL